jgi:hypothetical protein
VGIFAAGHRHLKAGHDKGPSLCTTGDIRERDAIRNQTLERKFQRKYGGISYSYHSINMVRVCDDTGFTFRNLPYSSTVDLLASRRKLSFKHTMRLNAQVDVTSRCLHTESLWFNHFYCVCLWNRESLTPMAIMAHNTAYTGPSAHACLGE